MGTIFIGLFSFYILALLIISSLFSQRMKGIEDFFLASRNLPTYMVTLTLCASWFGASSTLVSVDEAFAKGLSSFWVIGMPTIMTVLVLGIFFSKPIRKLPIISLPDLVEMRYGRLVRDISAFLIFWYMIVLSSSQMVALGQFLKTFLGTNYILSLAIGTAVVLIYSTSGGFRSVVLTDILQFFLLAFGILTLLIFLLNKSNFNQVLDIASSMGKKEYMNFFFDIKRNILVTISFTLAWTISPIAWQRIQSAKDERKAQNGMFFCAMIFMALYWIVVIVGMLSLPLFTENLKNPVLSELISEKLGMILGGLLFVGLCAAIMSTMDTAINTGALTFTRDFYQRFFGYEKTENIVIVSRFATVLVGIFAFLVATRFQSILKTLGLSSEIMAEGLFIPGVAMVFMKKSYPTGALLSLILGGGFSLINFLTEIRLLPISIPHWPFSLPYGLALSATGFLIGIILEKTLFLKKPEQ